MQTESGSGKSGYLGYRSDRNGIDHLVGRIVAGADAGEAQNGRGRVSGKGEVIMLKCYCRRGERVGIRWGDSLIQERCRARRSQHLDLQLKRAGSALSENAGIKIDSVDYTCGGGEALGKCVARGIRART